MMSLDNLDESIPVLIFRLIVNPISIVGNSIILYIAFRFKKFRSSVANYLISLLAVGELLIGIGIIIRAFYTLYVASLNLTTYPRFTCLVIAMPQIFGLIFTQVILLSMAIDRLFAVSRPLAYFHSKSMTRVYITTTIALLCSGFFAFLAMWKLDDTPAQQCSTGAAATQPFLKAWAVFGAIMATFIFGIYITNVILLIRRKQTSDHNVAMSMQTQKKVFISISLILLSYFIFWCLPLFSFIIVETTFNNPILLGYISLIIALCSGINSCVGIFIYLAKHQELKEYFLIIFPRFAKIKGDNEAQVGTTCAPLALRVLKEHKWVNSHFVVSTLNTASRNSLRRLSLVPQIEAKNL